MKGTTMKIRFCVLVLLGTTLAVSGSSTKLLTHGNIIYNKAAFDLDMGLTWEIRQDTTPYVTWEFEEWSENCPVRITRVPTWWLYVTETTPETTREFKVCRLELVKE